MSRNIVPVVVLVRSIYSSNVGASSRAMANMGIERMVLIDPKCEIDQAARLAAATGQEGLQTRTTYSSWDEFFKTEPDGLRFAFTARDGRGRAVSGYQATLQWLRDEHPSFSETNDQPLFLYLIFGPEDWGLSGADLELAHHCVSIPTYGENSSLNLGQAVLLALFLTRQFFGGQLTKLDGQQPARSENPQLNIFPEETLKTWLTELGMSLDKRRINAYTVLKRMILHNVPTPKELNMLETVLQQNIRKLRELKDLQKKE
jgi:tRNA/rRNA methyltransferase